MTKIFPYLEKTKVYLNQQITENLIIQAGRNIPP